jgi:hypothetical protein
VRPTSDLINGIPPGAGVVILASNSFGIQSSADNVNDPAAQAALAEFVMVGGVLVAHLADNLLGDSYQVLGLSRVTTDGPLFDTLTIEAPSHPMLLGADRDAGTADDWDNSNIQPSCCAVIDMLPILPAGATTVLSSEGVPALVEYTLGYGRVIATVITLEHGNLGDPGVSNGAGTPWRLLAGELAYAIAEAPQVPDPVPLLQPLIAEVLAIELRTGVQNSLNAQLSVALAALEDLNQNNNLAAIQMLEAFIISVENRVDNGILAEQAEQLISEAETIIAILHILRVAGDAG